MQLDFMRGSTQFHPLYSLQYHFSEGILHTPLGVQRGRAGGGRAASSLSGSTALFQVLPLDHYILGFEWETCRHEWHTCTWAELTPALGAFGAGTHDTLGGRGEWKTAIGTVLGTSSFLLCVPRLTFSPAALFLYRRSTSLCLHSPVIISFQWANFPPAHALTARGYLFLKALAILFSVHLLGGQQTGPQAWEGTVQTAKKIF